MQDCPCCWGKIRSLGFKESRSTPDCFSELFTNYPGFQFMFLMHGPGGRAASLLGETAAIQIPGLPLLSVGEEFSSCAKSSFPGKVRWRQLSIFFSLNLEDSAAKQSEMHQPWVCQYTVQYHIQNNVIPIVVGVFLLSISSGTAKRSCPELQGYISCCCDHWAFSVGSGIQPASL